ncbi:MAG: hypothetical protein WDW36_008106 [Sanguina aurantia]
MHPPHTGAYSNTPAPRAANSASQVASLIADTQGLRDQLRNSVSSWGLDGRAPTAASAAAAAAAAPPPAATARSLPPGSIWQDAHAAPDSAPVTSAVRRVSRPSGGGDRQPYGGSAAVEDQQLRSPRPSARGAGSTAPASSFPEASAAASTVHPVMTRLAGLVAEVAGAQVKIRDARRMSGPETLPSHRHTATRHDGGSSSSSSSGGSGTDSDVLCSEEDGGGVAAPRAGMRPAQATGGGSSVGAAAVVEVWAGLWPGTAPARWRMMPSGM